MLSLANYGNVWRDSFFNRFYTPHYKAVLGSRSNDAHYISEAIPNSLGGSVETYLNIRVHLIHCEDETNFPMNLKSRIPVYFLVLSR
jgi:hypothetical protein